MSHGKHLVKFCFISWGRLDGFNTSRSPWVCREQGWWGHWTSYQSPPPLEWTPLASLANGFLPLSRSQAISAKSKGFPKACSSLWSLINMGPEQSNMNLQETRLRQGDPRGLHPKGRKLNVQVWYILFSPIAQFQFGTPWSPNSCIRASTQSHPGGRPLRTLQKPRTWTWCLLCQIPCDSSGSHALAFQFPLLFIILFHLRNLSPHLECQLQAAWGHILSFLRFLRYII